MLRLFTLQVAELKSCWRYGTVAWLLSSFFRSLLWPAVSLYAMCIDTSQGKGYVAFTPRLRSIVEAAESKGQKVDVVYVSADASESDATEHFKTMPW